MINELEQLLTEVKSSRFVHRSDTQLLQAEIGVRLAIEISKLNSTLEKVTEASDFLPGGYALRIVSVNR